jgi:hypothetical protein
MKIEVVRLGSDAGDTATANFAYYGMTIYWPVSS